MKRTTLLIAHSVLLPLAHAQAQDRVLLKDDKAILLGGKNSTFTELPIRAVAGETITITIGKGEDEAGDRGVTWHLDDLNGKILAKGFSKEEKKVSWKVKLATGHPTLIVEDKDTNTDKIVRNRGNAITLGVTAGKTGAGRKTGNSSSGKAVSSHPVFKLDGKSYPKVLHRLGTCPEFGSLHGLTTVQVLEKMRSKAKADPATGRFLDGVFKQLGYSGFAEVKASAIASVELPRGIIGNIGYSTQHKTLYAQLKNSPRDLMAFRYTGKNGRAIHFMKTCGNHFYFSPGTKLAAAAGKAAEKRVAVTQLTSASIIGDMRASLAYVSKYAKQEMSVKSKAQRPFWSALQLISVSLSRVEAGQKTRNAEYLLACRELNRGIVQLYTSWEILQQHSGSFRINRGILALKKAELTYRTHFGQQVARHKAGGSVSARETAEVARHRASVSRLQGSIARLKKGKGASPRLAADLERKCAALLSSNATTLGGYTQFMWQMESLHSSLHAYSSVVNEWYAEERTAWQECSTHVEQFESSSWFTDVSFSEKWDFTSEKIGQVAYYAEDIISEKAAYEGGSSYESQTAWLQEYSSEQSTEVVEEEWQAVAETTESEELWDDEMVCTEDADEDGLADGLDADDDNDGSMDAEETDDDNDGTGDAEEEAIVYYEADDSFESAVEEQYEGMADQYEGGEEGEAEGEEGEAEGEEPMPEGEAEGEEPMPEGEAEGEEPMPEGEAEGEEPMPEGEAEGEEPMEEGAAEGEAPMPKGEAEGEEPMEEGEAEGEAPMPEGEAEGEEPMPEGEADGEEPMPEGEADSEEPMEEGAAEGEESERPR